MSKLSPFLQEVANDLETNGADASEIAVVTNDLKANIELQKKQCNDTEGMIWNPEANNGQGSCDMKIDTKPVEVALRLVRLKLKR